MVGSKVVAEKLLFGIETEWFNAHFAAKRPAKAERLVPAALHVLSGSPCLSDGGNGIFLSDGSRVYQDCGHVEFASCECCDPADLVAHVKAFERKLVQAAPEIARLVGGGNVVFARLNVDHLSRSTSYAQHESYLTRYPAPYFAKSLVPHLVSRIYCGEGGPAPEGGELLVSPRMLHFVTESANETVRSRPIFNLRDESLAAAGYYRLHVICSSTLASQLALYLKVGFTSLVVRCVELGGELIANHLALENSVAALHRVAGDRSCKERLRLANGSRLTAVEIQMEYLSIVRRYLDQLPDWATEVCDRLETVLRALEDDPRRMSKTLDWAIKDFIYSSQSNEAKDEGRDILTALYSALRSTAYGESRPSLDILLGPASPVLGTVARLNEELVRRNLRWPDLKLHNSEALRIAEIDTRFGILGDGIFDQLDRQGLLNHRVIGEDPIDRAASLPPAGTRAELRGNVVRRLAGKPDVVCTWTGVLDRANKKFLDLHDPWQRTETWSPIPSEEHEETASDPTTELFRLLEEIS